jgi:site-specific recombinase XerD
MTLEEALSAYLAHNRPSPSLRDAMLMSWARFSEFCLSKELSRLEAIVPAHIDAFHQKLLWEPGPSRRLYSANTVDYILRQIRSLMRWATKRGHLSLDPTLELLLCRPPQPKTRILTWHELQSILISPDRTVPHGIRDAALYTLITESDLGVKASLCLELRDVPNLKLEGKSAELMQAYIDGVRPVWIRAPGQRSLFLTSQGGCLGSQTVALRLDELAKIAGVEGNVTPRMLWRSYKAALSQSGNSRLAFFS